MVDVTKGVSKTFDLAGFSFSGEILVFGGHSTASYSMHWFSEEGEHLQDLSSVFLIQGSMCSGTCTGVRGILYSVGFRKFSGEWKWRMEAYDGAKWSFIWLSLFKSKSLNCAFLPGPPVARSSFALSSLQCSGLALVCRWRGLLSLRNLYSASE